MFLNGSQSYSASNFRTLNTLSGCTKLSLTVRVHCRQSFSLNEMGVLKYLHGFSRADITTDLSGEERMCQEHEPRMPDWVPQAEQEYVEILGKQLVSKCPRNCKVHKARVAPVFAATVQIDCDFGCPDCYRNRFYSWAHQWQ